ncbi:MAG: Hint domain-containing protein, partial [Lachnospiraceae bacterium]|nr:Hint domain-containing protein [Lachnospiraceae bacterium]
QTINQTYNAAIAQSESTYRSSLETAINDYNSITIPATSQFNQDLAHLNCLSTQATAIIDEGNALPQDYFTNPSTTAEVCFVAGTPILMADGTTKPIEQIRPGDMVLAVDHNDPEKSTPVSTKVLTFFDNGLKSVVKLIFDNQNANTLEITCTPEHPFYVIDKGWVQAKDLQNGAQCLNTEGQPITFLTRKILNDTQNVYNFEVEEMHTYYVGENEQSAMLVHNECGRCHGTGKVGQYLGGGIAGGTYVISQCPYCLAYWVPQEFKDRLLIGNSFSEIDQLKDIIALSFFSNSWNPEEYPNNTIKPFELFQEWLSGKAQMDPTHPDDNIPIRRFKDGDFMLEQLKKSSSFQDVLSDIDQKLKKHFSKNINGIHFSFTSKRDNSIFSSSTFSDVYNLIVEVFQGNFENITTSAFLGSYRCMGNASLIKCDCTPSLFVARMRMATIKYEITVVNTTSLESFRRSVLGNSPQEAITFGTNTKEGPMITIGQIFTWTEYRTVFLVF